MLGDLLGGLGLGGSSSSSRASASANVGASASAGGSSASSSAASSSPASSSASSTSSGVSVPDVAVNATVSNGTVSASATVSSNSTATANIAAAATSAYGDTGFSTLPQFQADKVQAAGNKGAGIKIGIIDSGVDYTRPVLGGCFGNGCKIAGGYDFVGDAYTGNNDPVPDADPFDNCYSHGTIAAGIIGANDNIYGVPGVAPDATLYQYRVFGCTGATTDDIVIDAMQRAYTDGVDIINLSLGEAVGWTEGVLSVVASRLVAKGKVITTSAGNQGQVGSFYAFSPGSGFGVINAGSSDNAIIAAQQATVSTGHAPITYYSFQSFDLAPIPVPSNTPLPIYTFNSASGVDLCTIPAGTPNLNGKIALVTSTGSCTISNKAQNAYMVGASGIFIINQPNTAPYVHWFPLIPYGMISPEDGAYLLQAVAQGLNPKVSFAFSPKAVPNTYTGNTTTFFSEIGPTNDLYMAPSVVIPGTQIISVTPYRPNYYFFNWSITDGTSWSSAFAAGSAALYLNQKRSASPWDIKNAFEQTAVSLPVSRSDSSIDSVSVQGSGKLQLFNAINGGLSVSPPELLLNDTANFRSIQTINIKNTGSSGQTYRITHVPANTNLAISQAKQFNNQPVPHSSAAANVWISLSTVYVFPGATVTVIVTFSPPSGLDPTQLPVYSGWINVQGGNDRVQVPYLGVAANMKQQAVLDASNQPSIQNSKSSYTLSGTDVPGVKFRLLNGSPVVLIDLVDANANLGFTPTYHAKRGTSPDGAFTLLPAKRQIKRTPRAMEFELEERDADLDERQLLGINLGSTLGINVNVNLAIGGGGVLSTLCLFANLPKCPNKGTFGNVPTIGNVYQTTYRVRR